MAYNPKQRRYIQDSYFSSQGIALLAMEQLKDKVEPLPSTSMIRSVWIELRYIDNYEDGRQRKAGKKALNILELDFIVERMRMYGSLNAAASARRRSSDSVRKRLRDLGILQEILDLEARIKKS